MDVDGLGPPVRHHRRRGIRLPGRQRPPARAAPLPPLTAAGAAERGGVEFWAVGWVAASGHSVVRILPHPGGPLGPSAKAVHERLAPFGLGGESFSAEFPLVAVDVPPDADLAGLKRLLRAGVEQGWWAYETG
ncbi:DUF4265 domain-containing protein [Dactylosporangium sp. NPDC051485]|uniref:DUF4265 domain-containing protein n=1 Tax=Dactylosporangium sp. NPDC051485 TaxID=3154846 RepID=UPI003441B39C